VKIACITTSHVPSTTANSIQVMKACDALAASGNTVSLWVPKTQDISAMEWAKLSQHYGISHPYEVNWLSAARNLRMYDFAWRAYRAARAWQADIIYTWMPQAALISLKGHIPTILELHIPPSGHFGPWIFNQFIRQPGKKRLLLITQALRRVLERQFQTTLPDEIIQISPNGIDPAQYQDLPDPSAARRLLNLPDKLTVGYSGHFYAGRGIDLLFGLAQNFPQINFLWVGGRPEDVQTWQERAAQAGLKNIHLTGFIEQQRLPLYQAAAEILLMPYERTIAGSSGGNSAEICSPMKMFDYMAAGRCIVASDLPVLHEVLNPCNAVFCPPEDLSAWQSALGKLINDPALCKALSEQAALDARQYSWQTREDHALEGFL
jgi:glycosyltransferase involved in cell wall biosynthesis